MPGTTNFPTGLDTPLDIDGLVDEEDDTGLFHDVVHNDHSAAIVALQTKVGIDGSADTDSHDFKLATIATTLGGNLADIAGATWGSQELLLRDFMGGVGGLPVNAYFLAEVAGWANLTAAQTALGITTGGGAVIDGITTPTANYTLVSGDANNVVRMNVATDNTVTVPPNSSVAFPVNTVLWVEQEGAGRTQLVPDTGVTFKAPVSSGYYIGRRYGRVMLVQVATDVWTLDGRVTDLTVSGTAPDAAGGAAYGGYTYTVAGGFGTVSSALVGSGPTGVTYNGVTHAFGTDTCTASGTYSFSILATDASGNQAQLADSVDIAVSNMSFDPAKLPTNITLSNSNRTATGTAAGWRTLGGNLPKSSGIWAYRTTTASSGGNAHIIGVVRSASNGVWPSNFMHGGSGGRYDDYAGWYPNQFVAVYNINGSSGTPGTAASASLDSDVLEIAIDLTPGSEKLYVYKQTAGTGAFALVWDRALRAGTWNPAASILGTLNLTLANGGFTPHHTGASVWAV